MSDSANPLDEFYRMWARAYRDGFARPQGAGSGGTAPDAGDTMDRWTEANVAIVKSGFHYVSRWAELSARAYPLAVEVLQSGPGSSARAGEPRPARARPAMDELREVLREMAELPMKEYERLQAELADAYRDPPAKRADGDEPDEDEPKRLQRRARIKS